MSLMKIYQKKFSRMLLGLTLIALIFSACDDSRLPLTKSEINQSENIVGKLIDSAVQGAEYRCGSKTAVTDENGTFSCTTLPVSFYIGAIELGKITTLPSDKQVFPQDIMDVNRSDVNHTEVVKLALLLQSLDNDGNASNGIVLEPALKDTFVDRVVVSEVDLDELKSKLQERDENLTFQTIDTVVEHLSFSVGLLNEGSESNITVTPDSNNTEVNSSITPTDSNISTPDTNNTEVNSSITPTDSNTTVVDSNVSIPDTNNTEVNSSITPTDSNTTVVDSNISTPDTNNTEVNSSTTPVKENNETTVIKDTTAPDAPTLLSMPPKLTKENNITVEVHGESNSSLFVNGAYVATVESNGTVGIVLDTSGADGSKTFSMTLKDASGNESVALEISIIKDTRVPTAPTLTVTPTTTKENSITVEVNGEANAMVYLNSREVGRLSSEGTLSIDLNTSGADGSKTFSMTIKDSLGYESQPLALNIRKDTVPPAKNSTINSISTDDTTPALSGTLPHGDNDTNTTQYQVVIEIDGTRYDATNNGDGTWSLADDVIAPLGEGFFSVNIIVTDEAGNESTTSLINKIEINNTGFLIDSAIEGIKYVSGSYSGYTDINGLFKYEKGSGVTFYIGDESSGIPMGTVDVKTDPYNAQRKIITLFDLVGSQDENTPKVLNMGKFLQSLDVDKDVSNGITIDSRTKESIALLGLKDKIDFTQDIEAFHDNAEIYNLLNDLAEHFGEHRGLVNSDDAKAHLVAVRDNNLSTKQYSQSVEVRGDKQEIKILTGVFKTTSGVVEGLEYRCGNQFGRTSATGEFNYEEGKEIKFYIYQLELGITQANAVVTPANLVASTSFDHPRPRNIIRLLGAFDAISGDGKVTIDDAVREALEKYRSQIDLNLQDGKANAELNIPAGVDEFGAQFEEFEIGSEILAEIATLRAGN